jgi:phosphohistidine phosphatase
MTLLIIRHAIAGDRVEFKRRGMPDDLRPLTVEGRKKLRRAVGGIKFLFEKIDLLTTSPLVRAVETAHIIGKSFPKTDQAELKDLSPAGKPEAVLKFLIGQRRETVALVGHEPQLGKLIAHCVGVNDPQRVPLKKGGMCVIEFDGPIAAAAGTLRMMLTPSVLRRLSK